MSSRVHPGETPASHVYNGFLDFILRLDDPRAKMLRRHYVIKLIPMLNPDGVMRGHYRTDSRGVNLNRMYLDPDFDLYPSIYASKALLVYHHVHNKVEDPPKLSSRENSMTKSSTPRTNNSRRKSQTTPPPPSSQPPRTPPSLSRSKHRDDNGVTPPPNNTHTYNIVHSDSSTRSEEGVFNDAVITEPMSCLSLTSEHYEMEMSGNEVASGGECQDYEPEPHIGNEGSDEDDGEMYQPRLGGPVAPHLSDPKLKLIPHTKSGIAMYVDLHAHASKRGCFIYGNYFEDEDTQVDNMLFSKLISMNTAHFDFTGCNFTERNMYLKDKREGLSKEGAGRVALFKALGIIHRFVYSLLEIQIFLLQIKN